MANCYNTNLDNVKLNLTVLVGKKALQNVYNLNDTVKPAELYFMLQALNTVEEHLKKPTYT